LPFGVIVPSFVGSMGLEKCMPFRLLVLDVKVEVVGVCGGEDGPACWAKLRLGVVGRMAADCWIVCEWQINGVF
jgi:hypothetical protein